MALKQVFEQYCDCTKKGSKSASDKTIKKICTDAMLFGKNLNMAEMDIKFRKICGNTTKEVNYDGFLKVLKELAPAFQKDKGLASTEEAFDKLCEECISHPPVAHGATKVSNDPATQRMTDVAGYTGSHKERFDSKTGQGKGLEGRSDRANNTGYVTGYKESGKYDQKS